VRYNRELVAKTLLAMKRVEEVRKRRERAFYRRRMEGVKERDLAADRKLVEENQHLLPPHYRDRVVEVLEGEKEVEDMELEEENVLAEKQKGKVRLKKRQKMLRDGTVEEDEMEMDA
jgi:large subunit ribosomal protein L24e